MPAVATSAPPITVEQYEGFEGYPGLRDELINGRIILSPQAKPTHQQVSKNIERMLDDTLRDTVYVANRDTNIRFPAANSMPAPDVFAIEKEIWREACATDTYISQSPLLAVEILSPANRRRKVAEKVSLYLAQGVGAVWIVSLKDRCVMVHRTGKAVQIEREQVALPEPLSGKLPVQKFFSLDL